MSLAALFFIFCSNTVDPGLDALIVPYSTPLSEPGRYRSPRRFDDTLDFYQRLFNQPGFIRWRNIVNLPGIRAKHMENLRKKS